MDTKERKPAISVVTPSYNMLPYLKLCAASVKDQGTEHEHVVVDGKSTDGTLEWLADNKDIIWVSEKDNGMYDALNKAISLAQGEIIGHLNCDEQYLPGILAFVKDYFDANPHLDFISADFLVVDPNGKFVAYRKSFQPRWQYFFSNYLYANTCTLFYRKKIFEQCRFDDTYKSIADVIFLYNVLRKGFKGVHVPKYSAVFTYSGTNLSLNPISEVEKKRFIKTLPWWYRTLRPFFFIFFFVEKVFHNTYREKSPLHYSIYLEDDLNKRAIISQTKPTFRLRYKLSSSN